MHLESEKNKKVAKCNNQIDRNYYGLFLIINSIALNRITYTLVTVPSQKLHFYFPKRKLVGNANILGVIFKSLRYLSNLKICSQYYFKNIICIEETISIIPSTH